MENEKHTNEAYREDSRLDRIEHHLKLLKESDSRNSQSLNNIETALIGNSYNGHKGIVLLVEDLNKRLEVLEERDNIRQEHTRQVKFVLGTFFVGFVAVIYRLLQIGNTHN